MIGSIVFGGEIVGNLFWGPFADKYGRRLAFILGG
jgi:MFS family permease